MKKKKTKPFCTLVVARLSSSKVHAKVREPHQNSPVRMNFSGFSLETKGERQKVHTNRGVQMRFANFRRVNQPGFRLDCRERY